jgi:hypothetical protein
MSSVSIWLSSGDQQRAAPAGHRVAPAPDPEPGNPALAELAWLAARGTGWVLRRSTKLVLYPLSVTARQMHGRAHHDDQPLATDPAGSSPRREAGTGVVVDLAAYRLHSRMARAARAAHPVLPPITPRIGSTAKRTQLPRG